MQENVAKNGWELTKVARIGRSPSLYGQKRVEGGVGQSREPKLSVCCLHTSAHPFLAENRPGAPVFGYCPLFYFIFNFLFFFNSIEPVRRQKLKCQGIYRYLEWQRRACNPVLTVEQKRYLEWQRRACNPVLTVQQKNSVGYQHYHFCSRSINRLYMGTANGELAVMYSTISYHTYSGTVVRALKTHLESSPRFKDNIFPKSKVPRRYTITIGG